MVVLFTNRDDGNNNIFCQTYVDATTAKLFVMKVLKSPFVGLTRSVSPGNDWHSARASVQEKDPVRKIRQSPRDSWTLRSKGLPSEQTVKKNIYNTILNLHTGKTLVIQIMLKHRPLRQFDQMHRTKN